MFGCSFSVSKLFGYQSPKKKMHSRRNQIRKDGLIYNFIGWKFQTMMHSTLGMGSMLEVSLCVILKVSAKETN